MKDNAKEIIQKDITEVIPYDKNPRKNENADDMVANSIRAFGFRSPIIIDEHNVIICGHTRFKAAKKLGLKKVPCIVATGLTDAEIRAYRIADNKVGELAEWDNELLASELELCEMNMEDFGVEFSDENSADKSATSLSERFIVPPFSVIDSRQGEFLNRVNQWKKMGLRSGEGRDEGLLSGAGVMNSIAAGTSIFNPALCEVLLTWFTKKEDKILDPFAGGSVRGIVSNLLERDYTGVDLRREQIDANIKNAEDMGITGINWICGDSDRVLCDLEDQSFDFVLSCPPYADLEVYSDNKDDLSNMSYSDFKSKYESIITKAVAKLIDDRFIAWVVGEVRDKKGYYYNFISDTISAFLKAGAQYYNEAILVNMVGTGAFRANTIFKTRKLVKLHQNILIFVKGDAKKAAKRLGDIDIKKWNEVCDEDKA